MSNPTSNFGWQMPTNTDLVTDLPADFEVFGQAVDTSMADLKGGTTGQILSKTTNADMDFTWINNDQGDITAVNVTSPITGGGTSGAVTVGIQSASTSQSGAVQLSDSTSSTSTVLAATANAVKTTYDLASSAYAPAFTNNFYAGKNKIINGNFGVNQRAFSSTTTANAFGFDRWFCNMIDGTTTYSAQTFTAGTAPVSGYESTNFARIVTTGQTLTSAQSTLSQKIEDVRTFANQTMTVSFWAKAASGTPKVAVEVNQNFGSGGSATVTNYLGQVTLTTSWVRYSVTISPLPSISGKTIGTSSFVGLNLWVSAGSDYNSRTGSLGIQTNTFDFWGVQVEAGSTATPFQTATGTIQGELAACQRYYIRYSATDNYSRWFNGIVYTTTSGEVICNPLVQLRTKPTSVDYSNIALFDTATSWAVTSVSIIDSGVSGICFRCGISSGTMTVRVPIQLIANNNSSAYIGMSAEL